MLIALIDDGIVLTNISNSKLKYDLSIDKNGVITERVPTDSIISNHGTTCAAIICKNTQFDVHFASLRIFHDLYLNANCNQLVSALEWCAASDVHIIHMSIGSGCLLDYARIRKVIAKLVKQNKIIVCAHSINEYYSVPACLGGVLGVEADIEMSDNNFKFITKPLNFHFITASSIHSINLSNKFEILTPTSNSYAAPVITSAANDILSLYKPFQLTVAHIYRILSGNNGSIPYIKPDYIDNAYIYNPYSYPYLKQHLFFNCIGEMNNIVDLPYIYNQDCDLVYLAPNNHNDTNSRFIRNNMQLFGNILYGGKNINYSLDKLYAKLIWDENILYDISYDFTRNNSTNLVCPRVNIYGKYLESVDILCRLRNLFIGDGYQCICLCNYKFSYLYGIEYIPRKVSFNAAVKYAYNTYNPDILLCCIENTMPSFIKDDNEYNVILTGLVNPIDFRCYGLTNYDFFTCNLKDSHVLSIYMNILEYFN